MLNPEYKQYPQYKTSERLGTLKNIESIEAVYTASTLVCHRVSFHCQLAISAMHAINRPCMNRGYPSAIVEIGCCTKVATGLRRSVGS